MWIGFPSPQWQNNVKWHRNKQNTTCGDNAWVCREATFSTLLAIALALTAALHCVACSTSLTQAWVCSMVWGMDVEHGRTAKAFAVWVWSMAWVCTMYYTGNVT